MRCYEMKSSTDDEFDRIGEKMKLDTYGLFVKDLTVMVPFYCENLGFTTEWDGNPDHADLFDKVTGFRLMLSHRKFIEELLGKETDELDLNMRMEQAFLVGSHAEVDEKFAAFKLAGIKIISEPVTYPWGQRAFYFADPEGNLSEIFAE
ncbi:VOC family protein [Lactococcus protaetiae]|uniref:VOC family protein n=2 Tax=Lactococcus protaetiae TaxID=2592653 RepID=A0A514Z8A3_9LACT|nr:VOC family protein [Lactococcus protaetiae]